MIPDFNLAGNITTISEVPPNLLKVGRNQSYALIDRLSEQTPVEMVCNALDISRSSYYEYRCRRKQIDAERLTLKGNRSFRTVIPRVISFL